jgi:predicted neutral ceramidase superfamily lipid hydrolase
MHAAELPSTLRFSEESVFRVDNGLLVLPASLVYGLIVAVVVCSVNTGERVSEELGLNVRGFQLKLNQVWGKKQQLLNLFAAMEAF